MSHAAVAPITNEVPEHEIKKGMLTLFIVQIFGTLSYSILMSSLTLFTSGVLKLSTTQTLSITGSFLAFNFGLHFLGGYMGGRNLSNRMLFCIGMLLQGIGCVILYGSTYSSLMMGLAVFLTGSGLNVTCMNNMVTQLFTDPDDPRREKAFLYNYSGMNIGFIIGMFISGYFGKYNLYGTVFALGGIANLVAIILVAINWRTLRDKDTYLTDMIRDNASKVKLQYYKATGIIIVTLIILLLLMRHSMISDDILLVIATIMVIYAFFIATTMKKGTVKEKGRMIVFCFFLLANLVFWTVYQLTPEILMLFMAHNVNMTIFGFKLMPQWINMINSVIIIIGGPFLAWYFNHLRVKKGKKVSLPFLFAFAVLCMGIAILLQSFGIWFNADAVGKISVIWIVLFFVFQSIGELCISPIGYAAIGKLVPKKLTNLMMGLWCMMTGVAALFAAQIGDWAVAGKKLTDPIATDPGFAKTFCILGVCTIIVAIIMFAFYKKLYSMINPNETDKETT